MSLRMEIKLLRLVQWVTGIIRHICGLEAKNMRMRGGDYIKSGIRRIEIYGGRMDFMRINSYGNKGTRKPTGSPASSLLLALLARHPSLCIYNLIYLFRLLLVLPFPYLQYCFCENPFGRLQFMLFLYFADHFPPFFVFRIYYILSHLLILRRNGCAAPTSVSTDASHLSFKSYALPKGSLRNCPTSHKTIYFSESSGTKQTIQPPSKTLNKTEKCNHPSSFPFSIQLCFRIVERRLIHSYLCSCFLAQVLHPVISQERQGQQYHSLQPGNSTTQAKYSLFLSRQTYCNIDFAANLFIPSSLCFDFLFLKRISSNIFAV